MEGTRSLPVAEKDWCASRNAFRALLEESSARDEVEEMEECVERERADESEYGVAGGEVRIEVNMAAME